jgi:putative PIN family toxin of toxin-antitoxin system
MKPHIAIIDTNVLVAGLITTDVHSPVCRIVDAMLAGQFSFLLSHDLLCEYRNVLLRPRIRNLHGLSENEIDVILTTIVTNAIVQEPEATPIQAPDLQDQHLWQLLLANHKAALITGDLRLIDNPLTGRSVLTPRTFIELMNI